ncbi:T-DNA border endonuclease virD2 [Sulfitobacter noctilucae]|uniref:relaxase/mobilization nuclease domain-containing protein n=1 Tax=Sulfitobacter noctilucae TaxID=1342302 RepID=UPI00046A813A|nr:relaxase/mobilization nuclease domain-containing protein [Sulfitobacter noctilucae]KIN69905.1 T-DNA border endonuclease virD2 [Sulfitobacter noctilucae]
MARNSAVEAVTGEIFREGWDRIRGSMQGLNSKKHAQLYRAARGHRSAVFKAIKNGGTHNKGQLSNQLSYITRDNKLSHFVDSRGTFDGKTRFDDKDIKKLTDRFAERWSGDFRPKLGNTTHMLMSFPHGTNANDVRDIASDVCERFFETDESHFDYVIAVHKDRDHPHAHIVLNRRSQEGEFFYLGRDHRFNYDDIRLAMVEEAEKYGVKLEATRRVDRGVVHYPSSTREIYAVKEDASNGVVREPVPRERVGRNLARTLAEIASTRVVYHSLASEASADSREEISEALLKAAELLGKGSTIQHDGDIYMGAAEDFDNLRGQYAETVEEVQARIARLPEGQRADNERRLNEIQASLRRMQPLGLRSVMLEQKPSEGGIYSETNINAELVGRLSEGSARAQIDNALRGTGINAETVVNRIETGAPNAALESQWVADDLAKVAETEGLNLERKDDLEAARERLNQVHVELGTALERAEVLRDDGVIEEAREIRFHFDQAQFDDSARAIRQELRGQGVNEAQLEARAVEIENRAFDRIEAEQQTYLETRPEIVSGPDAVYRTDEEGRGQIMDQQLADRLDREIEVILDRAPANQTISEAVASDFKDRYPDMPDHVARGLGDTYETSFRLNNAQELREAEQEAAGLETARDIAAVALRTENGVVMAEGERVSAADRREYEALEDQFARTDFNYPYSDDPNAREAGRAQTEQASEAFRSFAVKSPVHASMASRSWDKATDIMRPPEGYLNERELVERGQVANRSTFTLSSAGSDETRTFMSAREAGRAYSDSRAADRPCIIEQLSNGSARVLASAGQVGDEVHTAAPRLEDIERDVQNPTDAEFWRAYHEREGEVTRIENDEIRRVVEHERSDELSSPFANDDQRVSYREQIEQELDDEQIERLREGDSDALENVSDDRIDRLYAAKAYLQSDAATANTEVYREVVREIADEEYELQKDRLVDSEREGGPVHG